MTLSHDYSRSCVTTVLQANTKEEFRVAGKKKKKETKTLVFTFHCAERDGTRNYLAMRAV